MQLRDKSARLIQVDPRQGARLTNHRKHNGFTLLEIMIVVGIIGIILAIALPNWIKTRETAQRDICIENLQQIETAKQLWAIETNAPKDLEPEEEDLVGPDLYLKSLPLCPASGDYEFLSVAERATCSVEGHVLPIGVGD